MARELLGSYPESVKTRVKELYDFCYGIPGEAERILNEENPKNTVNGQTIEAYWQRILSLEPKSRGDFIRERVREAYRACDGWIDKMEKYLLEITTTVIDGKKAVRVYTGSNTVKTTADVIGLKLKYPESRRPGGKRWEGPRKTVVRKPKLSSLERKARGWLPPPDNVA